MFQGVSRHKMGDLNVNENDNDCIVTYPCIRALLMLFNIVFWISGLVLVWIGIWMRTDFEKYLKISTNYSPYAPYVLLCIGTLILFVSSLACSCIVKIQPTLLVIYGGFLITMLYTLISLSVFIYTYKDQLVAGIGPSLKHEIENHEVHSFYGLNKTTLDIIQADLHCCGNESFLDWNSKIPKSCCLFIESNHTCENNSKSLFRMGCLYKLNFLLNTNFTSVGVTTSAIALFPLFGTVFAFALALIGGNKSGYERIV